MQLLRLVIATAILGASFCLAHFWPRAHPVAPELPARRIQQASLPIADPAPAAVGDIVTTRGLIQAAAGRIELSPEERERLRFGDWARRERDAALAAAIATADLSLVTTVLVSVAETDPHAAVELARTAEAQTGENFFREIFRAWPADRLTEAAEALLSLRAESREEESSLSNDNAQDHITDAAMVVASRWPADDSANLLRWTSTLYGADDDGDVSVHEMVSPRKIEDIKFIELIKDVAARRIAVLYIVQDSPPDVGLQAIDYLPDDQRSEPIYRLARELAADDPAAAMKFLNKQISFLTKKSDPESLAGSSALSDAASEIHEAVKAGIIELSDYLALPYPLRSEIDYDLPADAAAAWTAAQPNDEPARKNAFELADRWAAADPAAASEWLGTLEPGTFRDQSVAGFVRRISSEDPKAATTWAASIADPELRERFMRVALRRWKAADPAIANSAILKSGLSAMAIESLLREK